MTDKTPEELQRRINLIDEILPKLESIEEDFRKAYASTLERLESLSINLELKRRVMKSQMDTQRIRRETAGPPAAIVELEKTLEEIRDGAAEALYDCFPIQGIVDLAEEALEKTRGLGKGTS